MEVHASSPMAAVHKVTTIKRIIVKREGIENGNDYPQNLCLPAVIGAAHCSRGSLPLCIFLYKVQS
jgi:hypothetical protein